MSEIKEFEGEIQKANDDLKQVGKPGNYKWGVMVNSEWYGFFGTKDVLGALKKEYEAGARHIKGTYKDALGKDGNIYHNIEAVMLSKATGASKSETADERAMREERERTDPTKGLSGAKQGKAEPRKEPLEERIGVEAQDNEEDQHYLTEWDRACAILGRALAEKPRNFLSVEEQSAFKIAVFEKRASPLVYLRENIRRARAEAGVK